jgi:hypothetical protein
VPLEELADAMFKQIEAAQGLKKLKPGDVQKMMLEMYGDRVDKKLCKKAIRSLIESQRCVYTYFGGSYIEVTPPEGTEK